jgi:hypothetical protein
MLRTTVGIGNHYSMTRPMISSARVMRMSVFTLFVVPWAGLSGCSNLLGITNPSARADGGIDTPVPPGDGPGADVAVDTRIEAMRCATPPQLEIADVYQLSGSAADAPGLMALADFDADGKLDVAVALTTKVVILHGDGAGGFTRPQTIDTPADGVIGTDFDAGFADLLLWKVGGSTVLERRQNPSARGQFLSAIALPQTFSDVRAIAIGLFDGNATTDVIVADAAELRIFTPSQINLGTFSKAAQVGSGSDALVAAGTLNGDTQLDDVALITSDGQLRLVPKQNGELTTTGLLATGINPGTVAFGDFNGDHALDFIVATPDGGVVYRQTAPGAIPTYSRVDGVVPGVVGPIVRVADVDGDGRDDVIVPAGIVQQCDGGTFSPLVPFASSAATLVRDLDNNGKPELLRLVGQQLEVYRQ